MNLIIVWFWFDDWVSEIFSHVPSVYVLEVVKNENVFFHGGLESPKERSQSHWFQHFV